MFKFLCIPVRDGSGPLLSPPSKIHPGSFPFRVSFPYPLSFLPFYLLSVYISVFSRPPPAASDTTSSFRWKAINPPSATADQCPLLVSCPAAHMQVFTPPQPVQLVVLRLGVGGGAKETAPPSMVWIPLTRRQATPGLACLLRRSSSLFDSCGARLSVCPSSPPPPFPVKPYLSLYSPS